MDKIDQIGKKCLIEIKRQPWFPYKSGNLKFNATSGKMLSNDTYVITFNSEIAPYVASLEEGSVPHDIPNAFGKGENFGIGGNYDGKFHPGSTKHKGFISDKSVKAIIKFICKNYKGELK